MALVKQQERRTVTLVQVGSVQGQQLILKNSAGSTAVVEISMQPQSGVTLQIFEGLNSNNPLTAPRFVDANLLWSTPGRVILDDLYLQVDTPGVIVNVDVRWDAEPEC